MYMLHMSERLGHCLTAPQMKRMKVGDGLVGQLWTLSPVNHTQDIQAFKQSVPPEIMAVHGNSG